jgi:DNA-binding beta-propeller fold protein YncE
VADAVSRVVDRRAFLLGAASLALAPRAVAGTRRRPLALVTADLEARLVAVDLASGRVRRHLATEPKPRSIEAVGETAVVAHSEIGLVSLVRTATLTVTHVLHGFGEPRYTAGHPDGRHAFVTDAARGEVVAVDVLRGRVVGRVHVGSRARHVTIDPSGRRLWVALGSKAEQVAIVDVTRPSRPRLVQLLRPPFLAHDVAWAPDGRTVWVSSGDRNQLALYRVRTLEVVARPYADWPPQHVTFRGARAYVTSGWTGSLRVYRNDGRSLRRTIVPVGSYNVQQTDGWVVTPGLGTGNLCILDAQGRLLRREQVASSSHDACVVHVR